MEPYSVFIAKMRNSLGRGIAHRIGLTLPGASATPTYLSAPTIIKEPAIFLWNHTFDKDDVWNLANFFPVPFGGEDGCFGAVEEFAWIGAIEDGYGGAVDQIVIGTVVNENDALGRENRRRTGFDDAGVKHSGAARKNGSLRGFGPSE